MNTLLIIIVIIAIGMAIATFLAYIKRHALTRNTVLCFTGGLGSGKTYMAVASALKDFKKQNTKYKIGKLLHIKKWTKYPPHIYSNIPIRITKKRYSEILTREHVLLEQDIEENAIIVIDEIGQFAGQYEYDNPYVMCNVQEFIRFYRHYINGRLIVTDQSSSNIVVPIRRRVNIIYCLNNFRRYFKILPFFKCEVSEIEVTEEVQNTNSVQTQQKHLLTSTTLRKPYFFGYLPYKWQKFKHYDTRCYSIRYDHDKKRKGSELWERPKTAYIIDIECTDNDRKRYKSLGKDWNNPTAILEWQERMNKQRNKDK